MAVENRQLSVGIPFLRVQKTRFLSICYTQKRKLSLCALS